MNLPQHDSVKEKGVVDFERLGFLFKQNQLYVVAGLAGVVALLVGLLLFRNQTHAPTSKTVNKSEENIVADSLSMESVERYFKARDWKRTIEASTAIITSRWTPKGNLELAYFYRGFAHIELRDFRSAELDYRDLTQINPSWSSDAWHNLAVAQERLGRPDYLILKSYDKAAELNPANEDALIARERLLEKMRNDPRMEGVIKSGVRGR